MSFAAFLLMFYAQYPNECLTYEADRFGIKGQICQTTASYRALDSRAFQCIDGVTIKNPDDSILTVYQCEGRQQLVIRAGSKKSVQGQNLDGQVILVDKNQNIITQANVMYVESW